jgi:hypothetical protein
LGTILKNCREWLQYQTMLSRAPSLLTTGALALALEGPGTSSSSSSASPLLTLPDVELQKGLGQLSPGPNPTTSEFTAMMPALLYKG